ncbi:hypothetical protein A1Q1_01400 [Trichosporon asahii var. asahii CBS 2479]|uniref:Uncharacterized protein n=1 Tax=Trichosporon asahii var. asahii (strain ATCC 90039 / CBS 2479 / JCM 2466 / KCTC 7840 / NBRC 103889/ NCYC 2677 / UAMH 7654) TaxID=1186058 RepID=J5T722_TRIAS|nr:hypothetical protein A1Q1_01400 [Trichosporon asahii var. asahii CBS 2479]EJT49496.1 hypothetical protein A1Q1_01400 [Trichosporon asahii var. asahii CBS 2479]
MNSGSPHWSRFWHTVDHLRSLQAMARGYDLQPVISAKAAQLYRNRRPDTLVSVQPRRSTTFPPKLEDYAPAIQGEISLALEFIAFQDSSNLRHLEAMEFRYRGLIDFALEIPAPEGSRRYLELRDRYGKLRDFIKSFGEPKGRHPLHTLEKLEAEVQSRILFYAIAEHMKYNRFALHKAKL